MKKGEKDIDKVTNVEHPNRLAPKRAGNIRKMYALVKGKDDVCKYVNRRTIKRGDKISAWGLRPIRFFPRCTRSGFFNRRGIVV